MPEETHNGQTDLRSLLASKVHIPDIGLMSKPGDKETVNGESEAEVDISGVRMRVIVTSKVTFELRAI